MSHIVKAFIIYLALVSAPLPGYGQGPANPSAPLPGLSRDNDSPLEITAAGSLEWKRNEKLFIARENARAVQGDVSIEAAVLTANYDDRQDNNIRISEVTATDNVIIRSQENSAFGQKAIYNIDEGLAVMTGDNLRMRSPDQEVTARDRFEYWVAQGRLEALGKVVVTRKNPKGHTDKLEADKMIATLKDNTRGERVVDTLEAVGNVVITTPTEVVTGAYGIYRSDVNKAQLSGGVVIRRGPNILEGDKAEVNLTTNTSRIFGQQDGDGRVRGVFFPDSQESRAKP